jgi:hypothetical protein
MLFQVWIYFEVFFKKGCQKSTLICFMLLSSIFLQINCSFLSIFHWMLQFNFRFDFKFVCCVAHLLWSSILGSYVVCWFILELNFPTSFKFNIVCVLCVRLLRQFLRILNYNLILEQASSTTLFVWRFRLFCRLLRKLQLDSWMSFKYNTICVLCVCLLCRLLKSCKLIFKQASSSTLFVCYVFVGFVDCCGSYNKFIKRKLH